MRNGPRKNAVRIERKALTTESDINEQTETWVTWRNNCLCSIVDRRGQEVNDPAQRYSETETRFQFSYYDVDGMDETMRIIFNSVIYDIKAILRDEQDHQGTLVVATRQF